ncbi:MAG: hypothetical protein U5K69_11035 [Balneolaceae bacterium]|nr:hypothetical protein [Balneolaceae bacterium]
MRLIRTLFPIVSVLAIILLFFSCSDTATSPNVDNGKNGDEEDPEQEEPFSRTEPSGASANDFLSDSDFSELVVEIDYIGSSFEPTQDAIASLETFLQERLHKRAVTVMEPTQISSDSDQNYTIDEIVELENQHRDTQTEGDKLTAYMLITDGRFHQDGQQTNVLGIAYYNTSTAFFGEGYNEASGGLGQASRYQVEATSFRHEFGHMFGLVGIEESGTDMQTNHQDTENGHHCDDDSCLMYYAMETSDLFSGAFGGNIPPLDQNCIDDLQANGGK